MSTKFITDREIAFITKINNELIQSVVGQEVNYYAISKEDTRVHRLYNEAIKKTWKDPIKINALVNFDNANTVVTPAGLDSRYSAEVYFHTNELQDRNVAPREGDFVEFGQIFFEITSVTLPQLVFGQANHKIMTKCVCVPSREGQFQAGNESSKSVDNSHPLQQVKCENK